MITSFYSLFRDTARACLLWWLPLVIGHAVGACSSVPAPETVPLENITVRHDACERLSGPLATPVVYICKVNGETTFVTTVKDCSVPEKLTFQTTTRQLFVGLLGLKVISQEPIELGSTRVLQTVVTGILDAESVIMSAFTFREHGCVLDIVLWRPTPSTEVSQENIKTFTQTSSLLTESLLNHPDSVRP